MQLESTAEITGTGDATRSGLGSQHGQAFERRPSATGDLLRAASSTLAGGAAVLPPQGRRADDVGERRPLLAPSSTREEFQASVRQRMFEELWRRFRFRIVMFVSLFVASLITMMYLFVQALVAVVHNFDKPCDQPLRRYLLVLLVVGQINSRLIQCFQTRSPRILPLFGAIPGLLVLVWGIYMIHHSITCPKTNPNLFYPTKYYVYGQACFLVFVSIYFAVGFSWFLLYAATLEDKFSPGCEKEVHNFPKVLPDDRTLTDPETGQMMDCPICAEAYQVRSVVRTPCDHLFHEQCLARWCKNHVDCPICRGLFLTPKGEDAV